MKKTLIRALSFCMILALLTGLMAPFASAIDYEGVEPITLEAAAGLLIDLDTDQVLYEQNADGQHYPASITKIMTALLTLEAVGRGELDLSTVVTVDAAARPDKLYFREVLYAALYEAYDSLTYREQRTVAKHLGFCDTCWAIKKAVQIGGEIEYRPIKPMTFEEISRSASRRSDKASERTFYAAMEKIRKHLESDADYRYLFG